MKSLSATVKLQHDPETGDLILPIPDEWVDALNWRVGDKLHWRKLTNGSWKLTNRSKAAREKAKNRAIHGDVQNRSS